jgi:feruloyl esterase
MFDGIIAGAPAMDCPGLVGTKMAYLMQANADPDGEPILRPGKEGLIHDAVLAQCDAADGAEDGLVADPGACDADLSAIACGEGEAGEGCLTEAEMGVVEAWRQGPRDEEGVQLYPGGVPAGSEPFWPLWLTGSPEGAPPLLTAFATQFGAYMAFEEDPGPSYDPLAFDLDEDPARMARAAETYNADDPDLSAFAEAGGRMLVWHGWADPLVTPFKTAEWHEAVGEAIGEAARDEAVSLHMIAGLDHCGLVPGPDGLSQASLDPLGALEGWLESGTPPETILREGAE